MLTASSAFGSDVPPGWQAREADGAQVFTPEDLQQDEFIEVRIYPDAPLAGAALEVWLQRFAAREQPTLGEWRGELKVQSKAANLAAGNRAWADANQREGFALYSALTLDNTHARLARLLANKSPALQRHQQAAAQLMQRIAQGARAVPTPKREDAGASAQERDATAAEVQPPAAAKQAPPRERTGNAPKDSASDKDIGNVSMEKIEAALDKLGAQAPLRVGGALKLGAYRCTQRREFGRYSSLYHYTLNLYEDLSVRTDDASIESDQRTMKAKEYVGNYDYKEATGALFAGGDGYDNRNMGKYSIINSVYRSPTRDPNKTNAFRYVTDARGQAFFYGLQEYADRSSTTCAYQGTPKQRSHLVLAREKREQADAERYKYRTKPGAGLKMSEIECYYRVQKQDSDWQGLVKISEDTDLLLKNGWAYGSPDYSPHDFDAAASRAGEPKKWFRWKHDGAYIAISKDGESWRQLDRGLCGKAPTARALAGLFEDVTTASSGVGEITHIYRTTWILGKDGTFTTSSSHKVGLGIESGSEEGTYSLDGYTLELRFKDGTVQRRFVYTWGNKDDNIVIGGRTFSRPR